LGFGLAFAFVALAGLAALAGFMGAPQQTSSVVSQPQGSTTSIMRPQSSHLYWSPFFFAKKYTCLEFASMYFVFLQYKNI
jgi:hypothetical protein